MFGRLVSGIGHHCAILQMLVVPRPFPPALLQVLHKAGAANSFAGTVPKGK